MDFLPDSNALIGYFQGREPERDFLEKLIISDQPHLSVIAIAEVLAGTNAFEARDLKELCHVSKIEDVNQEIAEIAASYRRQFSRKTKKVYLLDCLLAATCKVSGLTLVTLNASDYPMKDIQIVKPK